MRHMIHDTRSPAAILFDLDGVLVHSSEAWFLLAEEVGRRFRGRAISREEFAPTFGQGTAADIRAFGLTCTRTELDAFYIEHFRDHTRAVRVDPQSAPLLAELHARQKKVAIVTNTVSPLAAEILRAAKLDAAFPVVACADQVANAKPAPDLVLHALAQLDVPANRAIMIGDSRFDRMASQGAGVRFVGLKQDGDDRIETLSQLLNLI